MTELPRHIAQEPSISKVIEIYPANEQILAPIARIVLARSPIELPSYNAKRVSCHYVLHKLLCSIFATHPQRWELKHAVSGAPALISGNKQSLNVSMARSGNWLAAGVAFKAEIGIDIERIKPCANISDKVEFLNWEVAVVDVQDFYAKWTLWEASVKCVKGSILMRKNPAFNKLCHMDTDGKVARSGPWIGLHDCLDEKLFFAVVLQCQYNADLSHQVLCCQRLLPWPVTNNQQCV